MSKEATEAAIRSLRRQIESSSASALELEEKISRLEAAKTAVEASYDDIRSFVDWVGFYDVGRSWLGENREGFEARKAETKVCGDALCSGVEDCYGQICGKLEALRRELSDCRASAASMSASLGSLYLAL